MWNKLTYFVKKNNGENDFGHSTEEKEKVGHEARNASSVSVMSGVYELHPNLSVFHSASAINLASPATSPPASPSKGSRRSMFRRSLKAVLTSTPAKETAEASHQTQTTSASLSLVPPAELVPKKHRASLQSPTIPSSENPKQAPLPVQPHTPTVAASDIFDPSVEVQPTGSGSIRSILRDRNTPGTGRSVRFFSRDVYRVISPDGSMDPEVKEDSSSLPRSTSHSISSLKMSAIPADMSNLIDDSHELVPFIVPSAESSLCPDTTDEVQNVNASKEEHVVDGTKNDSSMNTIRRSSDHVSPAFTSTPNPRKTAPRAILSPEGTVFHSIMTSGLTDGQTPCHSFPDATNDAGSGTMFFTPDASRMNTGSNTMFFSPEFPTSPDVGLTDESRVPASIQELVAKLREQLSLQQQLGCQFQVDLDAREEQVSLLRAQLKNAEAGAEKYLKEVERRQAAMRSLRRKVGELEKICRGLEEEVERSREESFDRSIMDEASEGALVVLHASIGQLKAELDNAKADERHAREESDKLKEDVAALGTEQQRLEDVEKELRAAMGKKDDEVRSLQEQLTTTSRVDEAELRSLREELTAQQGLLTQEQERHAVIEAQWIEEKVDLVARLDAHAADQNSHSKDINNLRSTLEAKETELRDLKAEVEAQWGYAEKADEKIKSLEGEKEGLAKSVQAMDAKLEELGSQWKAAEAKRAELEDELNEAWSAREDLEQERDQLAEDVNFEREHAERLTQDLQEREMKLNELEQERQYALDDVARLKELLHARDDDDTQTHQRIMEREHEAEDLRVQMNKMTREHRRLVDDQARDLHEYARREDAAKTELEDAVRQKAEANVTLGSMKEQFGLVTAEVERLRRQVHDLQQESADKEVKLLQLHKARAQDKEDKDGLNIALDSKQQELELLKRKIGMKGTGGSTPAPNRVGLPDLSSRRQSLAFATPSINRPRPSSVTATAKPAVSETPVKKERSTLHTSTSTAKATRMKPPLVASGRGTPLSSSTSRLERSTSSSRSRSSLPVSSVSHRRSSSVMSSSAASNVTEDSEKENTQPIKTPVAKSRILVPA
ncbi:hypothetical protein BU17DRAFT_51472 [Hysterangium stoloniferum]|nr:hypothetical protein BU17DRAFT_51472 [Hysterangium stoloniferum]